MRIIHLRASDFKTSVWSGGTTTQLYLYPETGNYADRNFLLRISSATVDLLESDFTILPGIERFITPLDGFFTLTRPGQAPVFLSPLSVPYRFLGDAPTHCVGKATDFNLMLNGCPGSMTLCRRQSPIRPGFNGFFPTDSTRFFLEGQWFSLEKGELLVVFAEEEGKITFGDLPVLTCWAKV